MFQFKSLMHPDVQCSLKEWRVHRLEEIKYSLLIESIERYI